MGYLFDGMRDAFRLLAGFDPEVFAIAWVSVRVSLVATAGAALVGVPAGAALAAREFRGKRWTIGLLNTMLALPTVVLGLFLYALLSRRGFFGPLGLLYTPWAMVLGQFVLAAPVIAALTLGALQGADPRVLATARTLGASPFRARLTLLHEMRWAILAAVMTGFGRVFSEVGVSMMLGGNIRGCTRNLTTAIALQTSRGEFALGIALGLILLAVAAAVNFGGQAVAGRRTA